MFRILFTMFWRLIRNQIKGCQNSFPYQPQWPDILLLFPRNHRVLPGGHICHGEKEPEICRSRLRREQKNLPWRAKQTLVDTVREWEWGGGGGNFGDEKSKWNFFSRAVDEAVIKNKILAKLGPGKFRPNEFAKLFGQLFVVTPQNFNWNDLVLGTFLLQQPTNQEFPKFSYWTVGSGK